MARRLTAQVRLQVAWQLLCGQAGAGCADLGKRASLYSLEGRMWRCDAAASAILPNRPDCGSGLARVADPCSSRRLAAGWLEKSVCRWLESPPGLWT